MGVCISGIDKSKRQDFLNEASTLLQTVHGPLRLTKVKGNKPDEQILFLRERTWGEYFLEKLIRTPQEMTDIQNEVLAAIELALFPLTDEAINGAEKRKNEASDEKVPCLDDFQEKKSLDDPSGSISDDEINGYAISVDMCREWLRSRVLEEENSHIEIPRGGIQKSIKSSNGLFTVPKGLSVSTCPALQVIAHNVITGSVGAVSVPEIQPYSPLDRAVKAFKTAWHGLKKKSIPLPPSKENPNQTNPVVVLDVLPRKRGMRHVQKLMCIADDRCRNDTHPLAGKEATFWKEFYANGCEPMEGSIVRELYPDYYKDDRNAPGGRKPVYSENNIKGAVAAAVAIRAKQFKNRKEPVSIMFAGMDQDTYDSMCAELERIDTERDKANSVPPAREKFPENMLTPEKFPNGIKTNQALEQAVRSVPRIRKNLESKRGKDNLANDSGSESGSENDS